MRWALACLGMLLTAACSQPAPAVKHPGPTVRAPSPPTESTEAPGTPEPSQLDRVVEAMDDSEKLDLDADTIAATLQEATRRCPNAKRCALEAEVNLLIRAAGDRGDMDSAAALVQLGRGEFYAAPRALERILAREAERSATACEPPSLEEIANARSELADFAVIEPLGEGWTARWPTDAELDDLAYFYAGIAETGAPVGHSDDTVASFAAPPPSSQKRTASSRLTQAERKDHLYALADALEVADLERAQRHAVAYLESLGYPGRIDGRVEADQTWGGPRFAYVMRDLALVSEVVGEVEIATDLYRRAKPGGGACGTTIDDRRGKQLRGLIRSAERAGRCRTVVAERLLDWDHDYDDDDVPATARYGPARLAESGWDVVRLYRGALLTRNRDVDLDLLEAGLQTLPGERGRSALARLDTKGPEAWEFRVRATEGLADTAGRAALDDLQVLLDVGSPPLRLRAVEAIGALGERHWSGPCPTATFGMMLGDSWSNVWSRKISPLGTTCQTQLDDATADALARRLWPLVDPRSPELATSSLQAIGNLAAPSSRDELARWKERADQAAEISCSGVETWSEDCNNATELQDAALASWERWTSVVDQGSDPE